MTTLVESLSPPPLPFKTNVPLFVYLFDVSVGLAFVVKKTIAHPALFELFCSRLVAELELGAVGRKWMPGLDGIAVEKLMRFLG